MDSSLSRLDICAHRFKDLASKLVNNQELYFTSGYLNSEGMKILILIGRIIGEYCPEYLQYYKRARKTKRLEDVLKIIMLEDLT